MRLRRGLRHRALGREAVHPWVAAGGVFAGGLLASIPGGFAGRAVFATQAEKQGIDSGLLAGSMIGQAMTWTAGGFWVRRRDRASLGEVTDRSRAGRMATTSSPTASAGIAAAAGAACQAIYQWLSTKVLTEPQRQANEGMLRQLASLSGGVVIAPALAGLLLPVAEEVMFRGLVLDALRPHGQLVAIGGSTVAFVAVHAQFLSQGWRMGLAAVPPLIALGLICGYLAHSERLQLAVVAHAAYNCAGAGSVLLPQCPHQPDRRPPGIRRRRRHGGVAIGLDRGAGRSSLRIRAWAWSEQPAS